MHTFCTTIPTYSFILGNDFYTCVILWSREVLAPQTMEEFKEQEKLYQSINESYLKSIEMSGMCKLS